jgi:hypothetical protein
MVQSQSLYNIRKDDRTMGLDAKIASWVLITSLAVGALSKWSHNKTETEPSETPKQEKTE